MSVYSADCIRLRIHDKDHPCFRNREGKYISHYMGCRSRKGYIVLGAGKFRVLSGFSFENAHAAVVGNGYVLTSHDKDAWYYSKVL